jgi:hypothetical protein
VVKSCCAAVYGVELVGLVLGDSYHPGGAALTRRLAGALGLRSGQRVLDVAAGIGTSALLLAAERDVDVVGVDLGEAQPVEVVERHDDALAATIERVETRLRALRLLDVPILRPFNLRRGIELARRAAAVVHRGDAGYMLLVATR